MKKVFSTVFLVYLGLSTYAQSNINITDSIPPGFVSLFNGHDLNDWKIPQGDNGHWQVLSGVIDYDAESEAEGEKHLWTKRRFQDFILYVDWKIKKTPFENPKVPIVLPDGSHKRNNEGDEINMTVPSADSGIFLRGTNNCQINIWCWPIGSGEVYKYRMNKMLSKKVRRSVTPKINADKNIGEWNRFKITLKNDTLNVELNNKVVIENAALPGLPRKGAIGLQHHGSKANGKWKNAPSLVQFRNIYIKEL